MKLEELLAALTASGGELPETFLSDVGTAYNEDTGVFNGKIEALEGTVAELQAENMALKNHNYDLIMSGKSEKTEDVDVVEDIDEDEDEDVESIDELFTEH